jgi:hypothetical protein
VTWWDIDWDGEPFPPTAENMARIPIDFATELLNRLMESVAEESKTRNADQLASASAKANA